MNADQAPLDLDVRTPHERWMATFAERAKATGQRRAVERDPAGFERASKAISALAALGRPFDSGDVRAWAGPFESPNVIGAAFSAAKKAGIIRTAGVTTAKAASRHGGLVRLWEGVP